jgi:hypothetical protein
MLADHLVGEVPADRLRFIHDDQPLSESSAAPGLSDMRRKLPLLA